MFRAQHRFLPLLPFCALAAILALPPSLAMAATHDAPAIAGTPFEFILFAATLAGVALLHRRTLPIAAAIPSRVPQPKRQAKTTARLFVNTIAHTAIAAAA